MSADAGLGPADLRPGRHQDQPRARDAGRRGDAPGELEAVQVRHAQVEDGEVVRRARGGGRAQSVRARPERRPPRRRPCPSARAGRGGSCGSSRCRRRPAPAARRAVAADLGGVDDVGIVGMGERDREPEGAARAGLALHADLAAHGRDELAQMASPSPVPPYLRVVEESACEKVSKIRVASSSAMPMPVSDTSKRTTTPIGRPAPPATPGRPPRPGGELHRVAGQVEQHLPEPGRVAAQRRSAGPASSRRAARGPWCGPAR